MNLVPGPAGEDPLLLGVVLIRKCRFCLKSDHIGINANARCFKSNKIIKKILLVNFRGVYIFQLTQV